MKLTVTAFTAFFAATALYANSPETVEKTDQLSRDWRTGDAAVAPGPSGEVVFRFGEAQPSLKCKVLQICTIKLQPGETPTEAPTLGDLVRWSAELRAGGTSENPQVYVALKPTIEAEPTSMLLVTNKRAYHFELIPSDTDYTPFVSFVYPAEIQAENARRIAELKEKEDAENRRLAAIRAKAAAEKAVVQARQSVSVSGNATHVSKLNFEYSIQGKAPFKPARVFSDGTKTYIDLPPNYSGEQPVFIALDNSGSEELVNYRVTGVRYVIDKVISRGRLVLGVGRKAQKIEIRRGG